jgi:excisionase family DNA binding protein
VSASLFNFSDYSAVIDDISAAADPTLVPKLLFSRREAAYSLGLSLRSISYLLKTGKLKFRKVGSKTLIPHESLIRFSKMDHSLTQ